ncbi:unnamed protein product, partial [Coregonus sp. 'balchen']
FVHFIFADADFTLLWATLLGSKPETKLNGLVSAPTYKRRTFLYFHLICWRGHPMRQKLKLAILHFGNIDILINNGGRSQRSLCLETGVDVYQALMKHTFLGTVLFTKQVLPHMMQRGSCSVVGLAAAPLATGYSASKHALQVRSIMGCPLPVWLLQFSSLRADFLRRVISTECPGPEQSQIAIPTAGDQQHKISTSRCVCLILVGITDGAKEMWIARQTFLLFYYVWQYAPTWAWFITDILGRKRVQNF